MRRPTPTRHPIVPLPSRRTVVVVTLALLAAVIVGRMVVRAATTAESLGTTLPVWVAVADVDAGEVIAADDVTRTRWPKAFVPAAAVADDPTGLTVRADVVRGEVVVGDRVAEHGSGPVALIPSGWRGVAVPTFGTAPPLHPGSQVDVVAVVDPSVSGGRGPVLVDDAVVVHVDESGDTVTVAVPADDVAVLAAAQVAGVVSLVLAG